MVFFLGGFFVKYFSLKFEHSVIFSHWKLGSLSLLGDEKRGSNHLSIVNLPLPSISKANKQLLEYISPFFKRLVSDCCVWKFLVNMLMKVKLWIYGKERSGEMMEGQMKVKVFSGALRNGGWMLRIRSHRSMRQPLVNGRVGGSGGYWLCKWKRNSNRQ